MLRIHTARSADGVKKYFEAADYYSQGNETVGRWGGKLAAELGLSGTVDKASFEHDVRQHQPGDRQVPDSPQ